MLSPFPRLKALWSGELPLRQAFWDYAVFWGVLINLTASFLSLVVIIATRHAAGSSELTSLTAWLLLSLHLLPLPYNLLFVVGVWRSSGRADCPPAASIAARIVAAGLFALFLVI